MEPLRANGEKFSNMRTSYHLCYVILSCQIFNNKIPSKIICCITCHDQLSTNNFALLSGYKSVSMKLKKKTILGKELY